MIVVTCGKCGTKNRVDPRNAAQQIAKCGKCGTPLDQSKTVDSDEGKPLIVTDATFQREVIENSSRPVLLDSLGSLVWTVSHGWANHGTACFGVKGSLSRCQVEYR